MPNGTVPNGTLLEYCVLGNVLEKCVNTYVVVHLDAEVFDAVADYEVIHVENQVVAGYLVKDLLSDGYGRSFVFDNDFWGSGLVVDY